MAKFISLFIMAAATVAIAMGTTVLAAVAPAAGQPTMVTVYDQPNFKGRSMTFEKSVPSLAALDFNDQVRSLTIKGQRDWVLCENRNFMGRCVRVHGKASNLKRQKMDGLVSSLYPVPEPVKPPPH
jgi:hypothetical protein